MKPKFTKVLMLLIFSIIAFSCITESTKKETLNEDLSCYQNSTRPKQAISYKEMASMFNEYDNGQKKVLDEYITTKSKGKDSVATISQFFSLSELKQFIAYIEKTSKEKDIALTGVRIFTAAYPSDYKIKEYQNRVSFILAPTTNIGNKKNVAYEPLKSQKGKPVSMQSILNKYAGQSTNNVNRASIFPFTPQDDEPSSGLNRGALNPPNAGD